MADYPGSLYQTATDDFNRADSSTLGSNWSLGPESIAHSNVGPQILSNTAANNGTSDCEAFYSGSSFSMNQYATAMVGGIDSGTDSYNAVLVRASATDYVMAQHSKFAGNYTIYWYNAGTYTNLGSYSTTPAVNDVLLLVAIDSTFLFYLNGTLRIRGINTSAPKTGSPGLLVSGSTTGLNKLDNWSAGEIRNLQVKGVSSIKGISTLKAN